MAAGDSEDSGFMNITGRKKVLTKKAKGKIHIKSTTDLKANRTTDKTANENESFPQEKEEIIKMYQCRIDMEFDDLKKLREKTLALLSLQRNVIERLEKEIQELEARIRALEKSEQELKNQLMKAQKGGKTGSDDNHTEIGKHREEINGLKNTIAEKEKELQKSKETQSFLSVEFKKLNEEMTTMKDDLMQKHEEVMINMKNDITKKHEEDMAAMKAEFTKQNEEVLEQGKRLQNMFTEFSKQMSQKDQDQVQDRKENKPINVKKISTKTTLKFWSGDN
ncbi:cytotardin-like [Ruditapes philippinarum]|uniref:cytotardin-like n=1 Tax=Ruditapes philippinarum TaxID=129788 RepID=UPI00295A7B49|nr:cytotardin-like [Ruditapes philippinarum]